MSCDPGIRKTQWPMRAPFNLQSANKTIRACFSALYFELWDNNRNAVNLFVDKIRNKVT